MATFILRMDVAGLRMRVRAVFMARNHDDRDRHELNQLTRIPRIL